MGLEEGPDAGTYSLQMKPGFWQDCSATNKREWRKTSKVVLCQQDLKYIKEKYNLYVQKKKIYIYNSLLQDTVF